MKRLLFVLMALMLLFSVVGTAFQIGIDGSIGYLVFTDPALNDLVREGNLAIDELNAALPSDIPWSITLSHLNLFSGSWYPSGKLNFWFTNWLGVGCSLGHISAVTSSVSPFTVTVPGVDNISSSLTGKLSISANIISPCAMFRIGFGPFLSTTGISLAYCQGKFLAEFGASLRGGNTGIPGNLGVNISDEVSGNSLGYGIYEELEYDFRMLSVGLILGYESVPSNFTKFETVSSSAPNIGGWFVGFTLQKMF